MPDATPAKQMGKYPLPKCADTEAELRAGEIASLGLDTRKRWFRCLTSHGFHCYCPSGSRKSDKSSD